MNKLVATTLESKFYLWDMRTQHPSKGFAMLTEKVLPYISHDKIGAGMKLIIRKIIK